MMTYKNMCLIFGAAFVSAGVLGFIPNPIVSSDGVFRVNTVHNLVHLLTGVGILVGGLFLPGKERLTLLVFGGAYFGVAVLGFMTSSDMLLGIVHINEADRWLHVGLSLAILTAALVPEQQVEAHLA